MYNKLEINTNTVRGIRVAGSPAADPNVEYSGNLGNM